MIGVAGGTASGKSTVCDLLMEKLGQKRAVEKQVNWSTGQSILGSVFPTK